MIKTITIKTLKFLGIIIGFLVTTVIIFSLVVQLFFKDQLTQYLIAELSKQLNAKIDIDHTEFLFWKTFPNASVGLHKVLVHPATEYIKYNIVHTDTLLAADEVIFEFNIVKLLSNNYVLNKIKVLQGKFNLEIDPLGNANYNIFKKSKGSGPELTLKNIILRQCVINYSNLQSDVFIKVFSNRSDIQAVIHNKKFDFDISTRLFIEHVVIQKICYVNQHTFSSKGNIKITNNVYSFNNIRFSLEDLNFLFNGRYSVGKVNTIDFKITGQHLNLSQCIELMPDYYYQHIKNYSAKGTIDLNVTINGRVSSLHDPKLNIACKVSRGSITEQTSKIHLKNLDVEGTFSNGLYNNRQTSVFQLLKFNGKFESGIFSLQGKLVDLLKPKIDVKGVIDFELNEFIKFLQIDTFEIFDGLVGGTFACKGNLPRAEHIRFSDFQCDSLTGNFSLKNVNVKLKDSNYKLNALNGLISVDKDISFQDIVFKFNNNAIRLNGKIIHGLSYILKQTKEATVVAELFSPAVDLSDYFTPKGEKLQRAYSRAFLFPENLNLDLQLNINEFTLNKFHAKWIKCNLQYKPTLFILKSLSLETLDGNLKGNGLIVHNMDKHYTIRGQVEVAKINIQKAFYTFNNFGQHIVRDNHIKGKLSGAIGFTSEWDQYLTFNPDRLIVDANINVQNGELVNFEPMNGLSRFISLDELKNIKFSTLKNIIYIHDKQIIIPEMNINSSAFNISGSGTHHFDNHYQYKVKVLLSDVLYGKAKKAKKENEEYGRVEDDGLGHTSIYLNIEGFGKNYKISYDSRKTMDIVKESLVKQKQELKEILHYEFGWFKNDTTLQFKKKNKSNAIQVQFDDDYEDPRISKAESIDLKKKNEKREDKIEVEWE
jgi:hypothetical protein